jgi:hypothetical protein
MGENGSRSGGLWALFDRHEECALRACNGVDQNQDHDLLLNLGAEACYLVSDYVGLHGRSILLAASPAP